MPVKIYLIDILLIIKFLSTLPNLEFTDLFSISLFFSTWWLGFIFFLSFSFAEWVVGISEGNVILVLAAVSPPAEAQ